MECNKFEVIKIEENVNSPNDVIYVLLKCIDKNSKFNHGKYFVLRTYLHILKELKKYLIKSVDDKKKTILDINYIQTEHIRNIINSYTYPICTWCLEELKNDLKNGKFSFKKIICKDSITTCYYTKKCYENHYLYY
jgi:hypothetical protein